MTSMEQFYTRDTANEGVKIDLFLPTGEKSEHSITVAGIDSDRFRHANNALLRKLAKQSKEENKEVDFELELLAHCVISWTFNEELTTESAKAFLLNAPQIRDKADQIIGNRERFFTLKSINSNDGPKPNSNSSKPIKADDQNETSLAESPPKPAKRH